MKWRLAGCLVTGVATDSSAERVLSSIRRMGPRWAVVLIDCSMATPTAVMAGSQGESGCSAWSLLENDCLVSALRVMVCSGTSMEMPGLAD